MILPKGSKKIAGNDDMAIYEFDGWYYVRGLVNNTDIVFSGKKEWNRFSATIRWADLVINGEEE